LILGSNGSSRLALRPGDGSSNLLLQLKDLLETLLPSTRGGLGSSLFGQLTRLGLLGL
jgi:hypothetical protein